MNSNIVL